MTTYDPGAVVLVRFPFSQLHGSKKRPAVVIKPSPYAIRYGDLVVLALSSQPQPESFLSLKRWQSATAYASKLSQIIGGLLIWSRGMPTILADSRYAFLTEDGP